MSSLSKLQDEPAEDLSSLDGIPDWVIQESKMASVSMPVPSAPPMPLVSPIDQKDEAGFFYIIKTPDVPEGVYKIGKTVMVDPNKRLCRYPTYSCCLYTIHVANADLFEDLVMRKLKLTCKRRMEYGLEYYEADIKVLISEVHNLWLKYGDIKQFQLDKSNEKIKPNGWQYFSNEWLSKHPLASTEDAYKAYVETMKNTFMSNEYAEFECFEAYFKSLNI